MARPKKQKEVCKVNQITPQADQPTVCEAQPVQAEEKHIFQQEGTGLNVIKEILGNAIDRTEEYYPIARSVQKLFMKCGVNQSIDGHAANFDADTVWQDINQMYFLTNRYNHAEMGVEDLEDNLVAILGKYTPLAADLSQEANRIPFVDHEVLLLGESGEKLENTVDNSVKQEEQKELKEQEGQEKKEE